MSKKPGGLDSEDQALWTLVARSTTPLAENQRNWHTQMEKLLEEAPPASPKLPPAFKKVKPAPPPSVPISKEPTPPSSVAHPIDDPTAKKLAKGRQKIDARIDLHGMTQNRARAALLDFLSLAKAADHRIVLVITGKGNMGTGILKQRVPDWLSAPPFSDLVNGYRQSAPAHGGEGALYVRLRRNRTRQRR